MAGYMLTEFDHEMMALAIREAEKGFYTTDPNPRVGCVLVQGKQIVGKGWHRRAGEPHAEVNALRAAAEKANQADCYVTLEPCSHHGRTGPCADALIQAGVKRVVIAHQDPNPLVSGQGIHNLRAAGIEVDVGCMEQPARALNPGYISRMSISRPLIRVKMATSLDGRIALANGASQWITGKEARQDVQKLRARSSVVLTGSGTLQADNPRLNVRSGEVLRASGDRFRQPVRAVIDSKGLSRPSQNLFQPAENSDDRSQVVVFTSTTNRQTLEARTFASHCSVSSVETTDSGRLDLKAVVEQLVQRQCNELLVEAGPGLAGAFVEAGLVDELWIYQAGKLLGNRAMAAFQLPTGADSYTSIDEVSEWKYRDVRHFGGDLRVILEKV